MPWPETRLTHTFDIQLRSLKMDSLQSKIQIIEFQHRSRVGGRREPLGNLLEIIFFIYLLWTLLEDYLFAKNEIFSYCFNKIFLFFGESVEGKIIKMQVKKYFILTII